MTHGSVITTVFIASEAPIGMHSPPADGACFRINKILRSSGDDSSLPTIQIIRLSGPWMANQFFMADKAMPKCRGIDFYRSWEIFSCKNLPASRIPVLYLLFAIIISFLRSSGITLFPLRRLLLWRC